MHKVVPDPLLRHPVCVAAALVIPFYLGVVHWLPQQFLLYCGTAGAALAVGLHFDESPLFRGSLRQLAGDALQRSIEVAMLGGAAYLVAWIF